MKIEQYPLPKVANIFAMDQILANIPKTQCILDNMIITRSTDEEHLQNLSLVLQRLEQHDLRANLDKCDFLGTKSFTVDML